MVQAHPVCLPRRPLLLIWVGRSPHQRHIEGVVALPQCWEGGGGAPGVPGYCGGENRLPHPHPHPHPPTRALPTTSCLPTSGGANRRHIEGVVALPPCWGAGEVEGPEPPPWHAVVLPGRPHVVTVVVRVAAAAVVVHRGRPTSSRCGSRKPSCCPGGGGGGGRPL